jgi:hypothetical protein
MRCRYIIDVNRNTRMFCDKALGVVMKKKNISITVLKYIIGAVSLGMVVVVSVHYFRQPIQQISRSKVESFSGAICPIFEKHEKRYEEERIARHFVTPCQA